MWYLMKNNLKLIYRSRVLFFMLILLPVLLIALLSDTFSNFLETSKKLESFEAGYTCEENSYMKPMMTQFQDVCSENGIDLVSLSKEDALKQIKEGALKTYVDLKENDYELYQEKDAATCGMVFDNVLATFANSYKEQAMSQVNGVSTTSVPLQEMNVQQLDVDPVPDAKTYYGIVEILYMMWCGIISIGAIYMSENKHKVRKRYYISTMSSGRFYLGKMTAGLTALCIQMGSAIAISIIFLHVDWGSVFYKSLGILLLQAIATSSLSILLYQLLHNTAIVLSVEFFVVFIAGFLGGSFQTYCYSTISEDLAKWSPQYYINRTVVEYATKGESEYTFITIGILLVIIFICSVSSILLINKRREA